MHVVTKILIVIAAVATLALSSLVVSYTVNAQRIVAGYRAEHAARVAAEASLTAETGKHSEEVARLTRRIDSLASQLAGLREGLVQLQTENGDLKRRLAAAEAARDSFDNKIAQLGEANRTMAELARAYREEVTLLREQELRFRNREIDLVDRINEQDSQIEVLQQSVRALQEELVAARHAAEQATTQARPAALTAPATVAAPNVRGRVIETARDLATGKTLVRIDLGTADQIRENMTLYIIRGDKYLGSIRVTAADLQDAVAEVLTLSGQGQIQPNDVVRGSFQ